MRRHEIGSASSVFGRKLDAGLAALQLTGRCDERSKTMGEARTRERVREVLARHREELLAAPGAVGVGIGKKSPDDEEHVIVVFLESEPVEDPAPAAIEDVPVIYRVTGHINLQS